MLRRILTPMLLMLASQAMAPAAKSQGYPAVNLLSASTSIVGEEIRYPTTGSAQVNAALIMLAPGARTITHRHGVPLFAYILEGELTVDYGPHGKRTYGKGQAFMEAMDVEHFGINTGTQPVRLLAVYIGARGANDVIPKQ